MGDILECALINGSIERQRFSGLKKISAMILDIFGILECPLDGALQTSGPRSCLSATGATADKSRFLPGTVCPLMTRSGHLRVRDISRKVDLRRNTFQCVSKRVSCQRLRNAQLHLSTTFRRGPAKSRKARSFCGTGPCDL
jgi:hypothetical protein